MSNVVKLFDKATPDEILEDNRGKFDKVLVIGEKDGRLSFSGNEEITLSELVFWFESVKFDLMMRMQK